MDKDCIFCKIGDGLIPTNIVFRSDHCFAIDDMSPKAPVHVLIIPDAHIKSLSDLSTENEKIAVDVFSAAAKIANSRRLTDDGYRLVINQGSDAGQTVEHMHVHLLGGQPLGEMG